MIQARNTTAVAVAVLLRLTDFWHVIEHARAEEGISRRRRKGLPHLENMIYCTIYTSACRSV